MDRLRAFEVFATVVGQGSFTRAADKLETSPANVTRYVNELEEMLGARLLNRTSRRLSLTETGKTLYDRALSILEEVAEAEAIASSTAMQPRGRLRINAPLSFGILHLAPLWPRFMARYPDIELDISLVDRLVDLVDELQLKVNPVLLGEGVPLVRLGYAGRAWRLADVERLPGDVVLLTYRRRDEGVG